MADQKLNTSTFSLQGKGLKLDTAADLDAHIGPLLHPDAPTTITSINLQGNTIGVPAAQALAPHLSTLAALHTANLADIFTGRLVDEIPAALDALLTALLPLPALETVDLSDNAFGLKTQAPLVHFLEAHTPLRHLILNNNGLGPTAGANIAQALVRLAAAKQSARQGLLAQGAASPVDDDSGLLETVVCGRNRLENGSAPAWADALAAHARDLKEVRMAQNGIRVEGMALIVAQGLKYAQGLRALELQDNLFTLPGARALVQVVGGWKHLRELAVQDTLLSARGGVLLAEELGKGRNRMLEVLRLQYNEVDLRGMKALLAAAETGSLPRLRRLEVNGNRFAEEDPVVDQFREIFEERRKNRGRDNDPEDHWGFDELDEMDEESDEEDVSEQEEEEDKKEKESIVKQDEQAEEEIVAQEDDKAVDALADKLDKTEI